MSTWVDLRTHLPGLRGLRVHAWPQAREEELRRALQAAGFEVRSLEGGSVAGAADFFREASRALGLPSWFGHNWDAFDECLRELGEGRRSRLAVVWRASDHLLQHDAQAFLDAVLAFERAAAELAAADGEEPPVQLEAFLLARGAGFAVSP